MLRDSDCNKLNKVRKATVMNTNSNEQRSGIFVMCQGSSENTFSNVVCNSIKIISVDF